MYWAYRPDYNIGIATGAGSGLFVIDVDRHEEDGEATLLALDEELGPLPSTVAQRTGSGGRQFFFRWPRGVELRNTAGRGRTGLGPGIDTRGHHGYVVVPPSVHPCGERYRWLPGHGPHEVEPADLPEPWLARLRRKPERRVEVPLRPSPRLQGRGVEIIEDRTTRIARCREGARHHELYRGAFRLAVLARRGIVVWAPAEDALRWAGRQAGLPPAEVDRTVHDARKGAETLP
jgi:Bifunctional DNA primase/polymerase, N-terminal